jgi:choline monooxygenase
VYDLAGNLKTTPEMEGVENFSKEGFCLQPVQVETWGSLVFVNLDPKAPPLAETFQEILLETQHIPAAEMTMVERRDYVVECNWKVYVDNYLEGYHIPIAHPGLFREIDYDRYEVVTRRYHSLQKAPLKPVRGAGPSDRYVRLDADDDVLFYWVFPNLMLNLYPDNFTVNIIVPLSENQTLTIFEWYFHKQGEGEAWENLQQNISFVDEIQQEDIEICENVQRNLNSRAYNQGRFSVLRENGVHHFHGLVHEFLTGGNV